MMTACQRFSFLILIGLILQCCHSKVIIEEFETPSTYFSKYIGDASQFQCNVTAESVTLNQDEDICDPATLRTDMRNKILLYYELLRPRQYSTGCSFETKYENAIAQGVVAFISIAGNIDPGSGLYVHGIGHELNTGNIPLLEINNEILLEYPDSIDKNKAFNFSSVNVTIQSCDDGNPYVLATRLQLINSALNIAICLYAGVFTIQSIKKTCKSEKTPTSK